MGPDAVARIDSFVFNPDESVSHKTVTVSQGVFRYISGFAAKDQVTDIKIVTGTMSIRGSVVSGVVTPGAPPMLFVAQGNAIFSNSAGSTEVAPGQAIAVPSPTTPPMNPANLPPAVVAQALRVIQPLLPPPQVQSSLTQASAQVLSQQGRLNLLPTAAQQAQQSGVAPTPLTVRTSPGTASLSGALPLLNQANAVGLLNGSQTGATPQQQAFLNQVNQNTAQAQTQITQAVNTATAAHDATATSATIAVAQGLSAAAPAQTAALSSPPGVASPGSTGGPLGVGAAQPGVPTAGTVGATIVAPTGTAGIAPGTVPGNAQAVQSAITSPGVNVTPTVISFSEANPAISEAALRTALNVLGAGTGEAATMITSFAQDIGNVADCDLTAGQQMAAALQAVLQDPGFSTLGVNSPAAVALAKSTADSIGVTTFTPTGTPTATSTPTTTAATTATTAATTTTAAPPPAATPGPAATTPTFGNFGSIAGTGASTSPAL
jgi:hypothetical protein